MTIDRGTPHTMWNPSGAPARVHWISEPAMQCDSWFTGLDRLTADAVAAGTTVDPAGLARLRAAHEDTFRLPG